MLHLGLGYDHWGRIVEETLSADKLSNFLIVVGEAKKDPELMKKYFSASHDLDSPTKLTSNNGPCGTITNMQSDNYLQAPASIKKIFIDIQLLAIVPHAMTQPGTFTFQLPEELEEEEEEAKKGITKLTLLHACGTINYKNHSVTNITLATPSTGMEVV